MPIKDFAYQTPRGKAQAFDTPAEKCVITKQQRGDVL